MAFIDCVEWQPQSNDIFAWRYPEQNLTTATQLIVRESQEAVFFSKGNAVQVGKLQDAKAFKAAGQPRRDHTVVFGRQAPVAPPDQPAQHNYQCQDQY